MVHGECRLPTVHLSFVLTSESVTPVKKLKTSEASTRTTYVVMTANQREAAGVDGVLKERMAEVSYEGPDVDRFTAPDGSVTRRWASPDGAFSVVHIPSVRERGDVGFLATIVRELQTDVIASEVAALLFVGCAGGVPGWGRNAIGRPFIVSRAIWEGAGVVSSSGIEPSTYPGELRTGKGAAADDKKLANRFARVTSAFGMEAALCVPHTQKAGASEELQRMLRSYSKARLVEMEGRYFFPALKDCPWPGVMFRTVTDECKTPEDGAEFSAEQEPAVRAMFSSIVDALTAFHPVNPVVNWLTPPSTGLTPKEIRDRALRFAGRFGGLTRERADAHSFWDAFFDVFGVQRIGIVDYELPAARASTGGKGFIDVFWPGVLLGEHKSDGKPLADAMAQAKDYLRTLPNSTAPRFLVACDFETMQFLDRATGEELTFRVDEFHLHYHRLLVLAGFGRVSFAAEHAADQEAVDRVSKVHKALVDDLSDTRRAAGSSDIQRFLTRCVYLMFAEDVGLLQSPTAFTDYVRASSWEDLGSRLTRLFEHVLAMRPNERSQSIRASELNEFPYVNGGLFDGQHLSIETPQAVRESLLEAAEQTDWTTISPAIFGAMFQTVVNDVGEDRRQGGMHYTTEHNIMRVIGPMLIDDLEAELASIEGDKARLRAFVDKLGSFKFLDPACGCGNFLVVTYRELRRLERLALRQVVPVNLSMHDIDLGSYRRVSIHQFYGIEIEEFPAQVAQIALHIAEHLENKEMERLLGGAVFEYPLQAMPSIRHMDALVDGDEVVGFRRVDWSEVLPAAECSFVIGNPPFVGARRLGRRQAKGQRTAWGADFSGDLDLVTSWFAQAARYMEQNPAIGTALVATNSVSQGACAVALWGPLLRRGFGVDFAHRTFEWSSEAKDKAHVHVVIVGFSMRTATSGRARLFDYPDLLGEPVEMQVGIGVNPYLVDGPSVLVSSRSKPLVKWVPEMVYGSMPNDRGGLIVEPGEVAEVEADPIAAKYLRPLIGAKTIVEGNWSVVPVAGGFRPHRHSPVAGTSKASRCGEAVPGGKQAGEDSRACPGAVSVRRDPATDDGHLPRSALPLVRDSPRRTDRGVPGDRDRPQLAPYRAECAAGGVRPAAVGDVDGMACNGRRPARESVSHLRVAGVQHIPFPRVVRPTTNVDRRSDASSACSAACGRPSRQALPSALDAQGSHQGT